jgi:hypothetical protein
MSSALGSADARGFRVFKLDAMSRGWFVGNFEPTAICCTEVEVAVQRYAIGSHEPYHEHRVATEVTVIVSGRARMNGREFAAGDIIVIEPGFGTDFTALEDTVTTVVKMPSVRGDKYLLEHPRGQPQC